MKTQPMITANFPVERETEKAYLIRVDYGFFSQESRLLWVPKSCCKSETYIATVNPVTGEPKDFGIRVTEVAAWWARENRI